VGLETRIWKTLHDFSQQQNIVPFHEIINSFLERERYLRSAVKKSRHFGVKNYLLVCFIEMELIVYEIFTNMMCVYFIISM
jgi:hypothetical protein